MARTSPLLIQGFLWLSPSSFPFDDIRRILTQFSTYKQYDAHAIVNPLPACWWQGNIPRIPIHLVPIVCFFFLSGIGQLVILK